MAQRIVITNLLQAVSMCGAAVRLVRDYGEEMDGTRFEHLFDFVLQKLPSGTVMENGPHHSGRNQAVPMTNLRNETVKQRRSTRGIILYTGMHNSHGSRIYVDSAVNPGFIVNMRIHKMLALLCFVTTCSLQPSQEHCCNSQHNVPDFACQELKDKAAVVTAGSWRQGMGQV